MWGVVWGVAFVVLAAWAVSELVQAVMGPAPTTSPWRSSDQAMLLVCFAMFLHLADGEQSWGRLLGRCAIIAAVLGPFVVNYVRWKRSLQAPTKIRG